MAKIVKIKVEFGTSQAKGPNNWLKANTGIEIELEGPDDLINVDKIWEDAWYRVTEEVAKQLLKFDGMQ